MSSNDNYHSFYEQYLSILLLGLFFIIGLGWQLCWSITIICWCNLCCRLLICFMWELLRIVCIWICTGSWNHYLMYLRWLFSYSSTGLWLSTWIQFIFFVIIEAVFFKNISKRLTYENFLVMILMQIYKVSSYWKNAPIYDTLYFLAMFSKFYRLVRGFKPWSSVHLKVNDSLVVSLF